MKKVITRMLAFAALMLCGGAWAEDQVLVSDHLTTSAWVDTNWTVDSLDELMTYSYYGTMAGGSIGGGSAPARGFIIRKEGATVTVQMQVRQKATGEDYLKVAKFALTLNDQKHVLVKGVAAGYLSGVNVGTEVSNWNSTFGSGAYGISKLVATKLPSAFSKPGVRMWLDASDSSTITSDSEGVKKWADKFSNTQDATPSTAYIMVDGEKTGVTRYASVATVNGNTSIQMGTVPSGIDLAFTQMTDIRTVFWVMDIQQNGNAFFLADSGSYHFHRNVNQYVNGDASTNVRNGTWKCDGLKVNPTGDTTPTGHHIYSLVTTGNVTANSLSQDRQVSDQRNGGRAISELIVFNRALSAEEVAEVEAYLANKWTIVQSTEETVTNLAEGGSTTWGAIGTKANVTLNVTGNARLGVGGSKSISGRFLINVAPGAKLTIYDNGNVGYINAATSVYITGGGTVETPTFQTLGTPPRVYIEKGSTWTINNGSSTVDARSWNLSRIQGEGTIELIGSNWVGFPTSAANMFATTLSVKANNTTGVVCANESTTEMGTLSGSYNLRTDLGTATTRIIRVLQSEDSTWSGKFTNDRLSTLKIAGYPGATSKTLTLTATFTENDNLEVEASGSVKLNGTWKGTTETISGEFGGSGSITDATTITVNNGAMIRADWGAVTANVAPTFASGAVIGVVAESIPAGNKIKLFSGSGFTASENVAKARILSTAGEVLSFGTVAVEADGVYAIASAEAKNPTLYYGYAMTGSVNNMIVKEEDASNQLTKGGNFATGDFSDGKLNLGTNAGSHYGTGGAYPQGDFTFITLVKTASSANKAIFAFGGTSGTSGLVGLRYAGNDRVCLFTGGGLDLAEVRALDSANTFHVYTIKYSKSTGMIQMSVDKGPYTTPVAFTSSASGQWQFGGIHSGQINGFAENANGGQMGEFRVYASELTDAERDAFVDEFMTPVAQIGDVKYFTLSEACEVAAKTVGDVTVKMLANSSETINLAANTTLDVNGKTFSGVFMGTGDVLYTGTAPSGAAKTSLTDAMLWKGTLWLKEYKTASSTDKNLVLSGYANDNSYVGSISNRGWFNSGNQAKNLVLKDDGDTPALWQSDSSSGYTYTFPNLLGTGTFKVDSVAVTTANVVLQDLSEFEGSLVVNNKHVTIGTSGTAANDGKLVVASGATAKIANGKTWSTVGGFDVNGTIKGSGAITGGNLTFGDGATIDLTDGVLTANLVATFGSTIKVVGGAVDQVVLKGATLASSPTVQDGNGADIGYLMATDDGIVITASAPVSEYTLTDDDKTAIATALETPGAVLAHTIKGIAFTDNATIEGVPSDCYLISQMGSTLYFAKKTKSVSIKFCPASATEGTIAATDDKVGGFPVAGAFWNHSKQYTGTGDATTELMSSIKDGQGNTLENTKVYYYMPNMYDVNKRGNNVRNYQTTGNGKLTYSYFDDTNRTTPSSWPYTVLTDNGTNYTIPRTPAASDSATANLGWCVAIQGMPYQVFDLYIYQASDQTAESITLLPIAVKANSGEWQYFAGDNKGSTIKTTINATWDGAAYCDTKVMTEGKNYIRYRISRATLGLADDEEIETIYLSHPSRSTYTGRLGLAGIQIVEVENDGFYNRKADESEMTLEAKYWTAEGSWLNSSGSPINWPTTKETAYVNINADTVAEITVNDKITADMVTVKNAADAQDASFKFLTLEDLGEVATEKPDAPYILNAPVDATGFHGDLYLQSRISGLVSVNSGVTVNFVANVAGEETTAYPYNFTGAINPIKKHGPGSFLVPSTMTGLSFNMLAGTLHYATDGTVPSVTGTGNVLITGGTIKYGNFNTFSATPVTVDSGAILDVNGKDGSTGYSTVTLNGGKLANSVAGHDTTTLVSKTWPVTSLTLNANSAIGGAYAFGLVNGGHGETTLNLNTYTLTKVDANHVVLCNTTINGTGTIEVSSGEMSIRSPYDSSATSATIQVNTDATFDIVNNTEFVVKNLVGNGGTFATTNDDNGHYKVTGTLSGTGTFGRVTFADGATIDATSGTRTFTATPTFGSTLTIKVPATGEPVVMTFGAGVEAPTLPATITLVDAQGETVTTHGAEIIGSALKIVRKTATNVYVLANSTGYELADGTATTVIDGDTIIYDGDHFTAGVWGSGPDISAYTGTHKFIFDQEMDIGHGNGIPANAQVEVNGQCYLYGDIGASATITGSGTLTVGFGGSHESTINGGVTIACSFGPGRTGTAEPYTPNKAKIAGTVNVTGSNSIQGYYELLENGSLTLKSAAAGGKVTSGVEGSSVVCNDFGTAGAQYTLVATGSDPEEIVVPEGATEVSLVPGQEATYTGEAPTVTVKITNEAGGAAYDVTDYCTVTTVDGKITTELKDNETTQPEVTTMAAPTEEETDKVQFTISNPIPGLFYSIVSANGPTDADFTAQTAVDSTGVQATNSDPHTTSIDMPTDAKVKYFRVRVKATK